MPKWWERALENQEANLPREERFRGNWLDLKDVVKNKDDSYVTLEISSDRIKVPTKTFDSVSEISAALRELHAAMSADIVISLHGRIIDAHDQDRASQRDQRNVRRGA